VETDERGFRIALVAHDYLNPPAGGLDALAVLQSAGWGVIQLPSDSYPDDVAALLLEQVAEQASEFANHGYDLVVVGARAGLEGALAELDVTPPDAIAPVDEAELQAFIAARGTELPRSAAS
jgi:MinD-like ATPase involved in chromosome partitioning or flagellar assembly